MSLIEEHRDQITAALDQLPSTAELGAAVEQFRDAVTALGAVGAGSNSEAFAGVMTNANLALGHLESAAGALQRVEPAFSDYLASLGLSEARADVTTTTPKVAAEVVNAETPQALQPAKLPKFFYDIGHRLSEGKDTSAGPIDGFEDVFGRPVGDGEFYNTSTSRAQLFAALYLSPHPAVRRIMGDPSISGSRNIIAALRAEQVLAGMKILDLGCGVVPGFAIAAKALGAEVYTVDADNLDAKTKAKIDGHTVVNLNAANAGAILEQATVGQFDMVTENVIGTVPGGARVDTPDRATLRGLATRLLKSGGHFYHVNDLYQKP